MRHIGNVMSHGLGAATKIDEALSLATNTECRRVLLSALHSVLIIVEEARQAMDEDIPRAMSAIDEAQARANG